MNSDDKKDDDDQASKQIENDDYFNELLGGKDLTKEEKKEQKKYEEEKQKYLKEQESLKQSLGDLQQKAETNDQISQLKAINLMKKIKSKEKDDVQNRDDENIGQDIQQLLDDEYEDMLEEQDDLFIQKKDEIIDKFKKEIIMDKTRQIIKNILKQKLENTGFHSKVVNDEQFLINAKKIIDDFYDKKNNIPTMIENNIIVQELIEISQKNDQFYYFKILLKKMIEDIENQTFNWETYEQDLDGINKFISIFNGLSLEQSNLFFINVDKIQAIFPLQEMVKFFGHPPFYVKLLTQDKINMFYCNTLRIISFFYLDKIMHKNATIRAENISQLDPCIRILIRKYNGSFFKKNFHDFNIFHFVLDLIDRHLLTINPRFNLKNSTPFLQYLLELILQLYDYGLLNIQQSKKLMSNLFQVSEIIENYEQKAQKFEQEKYSEQEFTLIIEFLKKCREIYCSLCIHHIMLSCDDSLAQNITNKQDPFENFIFNQPSSFTFLTNITIKYLSSYKSINKKSLSTSWQKEALQEIFYFLGEQSNDIFLNSMALIRNELFDYYYELIQSSENKIEVQLDIQNDINRFFSDIRNQQVNNSYQKQVKAIFQVLRGYAQDLDHFSKILMTKQNIHYQVMIILYYILGQQDKQLFYEGLNVFQLLISNYLPAQSALFQQGTSDYFKHIMLKKNLETMMMMKDVFVQDSNLINLSPNVFLFNFMIYKFFLQKLNKMIKNQKMNKSMKITIAALFLYHQFFLDVLEDHNIKVKRKRKFNLQISHELCDYFYDNVYQDFVINPQQEKEGFTDLDFNLNLYRLENIDKYKDKIAKIDPKYFLYQFNYSVFKVFNRACFYEYSGYIYTKYNKSQFKKIINFDQINMKILKIFHERIKLFDRFYIYPQNHLITNRNLFFANKGNYLAEHVFIFKHSLVFKNIYSWIDYIDKYLDQKFLENSEIQLIMSILFKGIFASSIKYAQGCKIKLFSLTQNINKTNTQSEIVEIFTEIDKTQGEELQQKIENSKQSKDYEFYKFVSKLFDLSNSYDINKNIDQFKNQFVQSLCFYIANNLFHLNIVLLNLYQKFNEKANFGRDINEQMLLKIDENKKMFLVKSYDFQIVQIKNLLVEQINNFTQDMNFIYEKSEFQYIIQRFQKSSEFNDQSKWGKIAHQNSLLKATTMKLIITQQKSIEMQSYLYKSFFKPFKQQYKKIKQEILSDNDENNFLQTVISEKEQGQNMKNLIWYFIIEINEMKVNLNEDNLNFENEFFFNEQFTFLIINIDSLMVWRNQIKQQFYEEILNPPTSFEENKISPLEILQKLTQIQYILYKLVIYKTFQDQLWEEYRGLYFIIGNFFDNIITNNNDFRKLLASPQCKGALKLEGNLANNGFDIFFENYMMMEVGASESPFWLDQQHQITLEDQSHLFQIIKKLIETMTKYLNGLMQENQIRIHTYRIDIWNGIIDRIIDDLNSPFYEVKNAIIKYFIALLEGFPNEVVSFLFSNFDIQKIYNQIIILVIKLIIYYQRFEEKKKFANKKQKNLIGSLGVFKQDHIVTDQDVKDFVFHDEDILLKVYKKNEKEFGNHFILKIVINLYILIRNMSFKIKFYQLFLEEKDKQVQDYFNGKIENQISQRRRNEIIVHKFLLDIVEDIEVQLEIPKENKNHMYLQKILFKKTPECFFLNSIRKENFINDMDITSQTTKQQDLFLRIIPFSYVMNEQQKYYQKYGKFYFITTEEFYKTLHYFLYLFSLIINIILLFAVKFNPVEDQEEFITSKPIVEGDGLDIAIFVLGILIIGFSLIFSILWIFFRRRIKAQQKILELQEQKSRITLSDRLYILIFRSLLFEARFRSFYLHLIFSSLGMGYNFFFYTLNLLLVANLSKTLNYVMMAIVKHWGKFLLTILITIIVVLFYSFIMLSYFSDQQSGNFENPICDSFAACFLNSVNFGLRFGGGMSDAYYLLPDPNSELYWGRFFFDITFFFLVKMVFLNLISGIIIDTFSQLRDELNEREKDANYICFICGLSKWQVEKKGQNFSVHINNVHEKWQYLYFMTRLEYEKKSNFTGFEQTIWEKYNKDDTSWFPNGVFLKDNDFLKKLYQQIQFQYHFKFLIQSLKIIIFLFYFKKLKFFFLKQILQQRYINMKIYFKTF